MKRIAVLSLTTALAIGAFGTSPSSAAEAKKAKTDASESAAGDARAAKAAENKTGATTQPSAFMLVVPIPVARVSAPPVVPYGGALAPDVEAMRDTLASATEAALTEDGFNDFVERLVDADRNRIGKFEPGDVSALNGAAARVRTAWKDKFDDDFDIDDEGDVYASFPVVQGMINRPLDPAVKALPANAPEDYNLEPGREVAVVTLPARHGLDEATILMIDEAFGWKIDVPNTIDGRDLHGNLVQHLNALADSAAKWPKNRQAAARYITHHVMLGAMGHDGQTASARK